MKRSWLVAMASVAMTAGMAAGFSLSASAGPVGGLDALKGSAGSVVEKTHGCHAVCEWTRWRGWHRHVGPNCRPRECSPGAGWRYEKRCWWGPGGVKHCRFGF